MAALWLRSFAAGYLAAYLTGQIHDVRAALWSIGSLIIIFMTCVGLACSVGKL